MFTLTVSLFAFGLLGLATPQIIPGEPPAFPSSATDDPRDQVVFDRDADGNPVSLVFRCPVTGSGPPVIDWYRNVSGTFMMDNDYGQEDGSYIFPHITEANSTYANRDGIQYYCTASNDFGTIRSRIVRAFYADFNGFAVNGTKVQEATGPIAVTVDVIIADPATNLQWVSLECEVVPGSTPTPHILWIRTDTGGDIPEILTEDFVSNTVRFIDGGQWLILETTEAAVIGKEYCCQVTNKQIFQTVRGPITYTLNPVTSFTDEPDGIKIYKPLISRTVPRLVDPDVNAPASSPDRVAFGVGVAYSGTGQFTQTWRVNGRPGGTRALAGGPVTSILPYLTGDDTDSILSIKLIISPDIDDEEEILLTATFTLLDPAVIVDPKPQSVGDRLSGDSQSFTCLSEGSDPQISFYHNGVRLEEGVSGDTLTIPSTTPANTGMYQCSVENESGSDSFSWYLIVRDPIPPAVVSSYAVDPDQCLGFSFIQQDNPPVLLSVNITADPCPNAAWSKDGGPLPASGFAVTDGCEGYSVGDKSFLFSLAVDDLTKEGGALGAYGVTFTNVKGSVKVPEITVIGKVQAKIKTIRPDPHLQLIERTGAGCLSSGRTINIICENEATPTPTVEFWKDNIPLDPSTDDRLTLTCDTLTISEVARGDEGTYSCRILSIDGEEDISDPLKLDYCIAPSIVEDLTFTRNSLDEGDETTAFCEWTGSPDPTVTWYKDGSPLREQDLPSRIRITEDTGGGTLRSNLQIYQTESSDTGDYTCNVSNPLGFDVRVINLRVSARPSRNMSFSLNGTQRNCSPSPNASTDPGPEDQNSMNGDGIKLAVGFSVGFFALGFFIFVSVLTISFVMWRGGKPKENKIEMMTVTYHSKPE